MKQEQEEKTERETEKIFKETIVGNYSNLLKFNLRIKKAHQTPRIAQGAT